MLVGLFVSEELAIVFDLGLWGGCFFQKLSIDSLEVLGIDVDFNDQGLELFNDGSRFEFCSEERLDLFERLFFVVGGSKQFHAVGQRCQALFRLGTRRFIMV